MAEPSSLLHAIQMFRQCMALGNFKIRSRSGKLISLQENAAQREFLDVLETQARLGVPLRVIIPKARQVGVTTVVQALLRYLAKHVPHWQSYTAAHTGDSTRAIFGISKRIERFDPDGGRDHKQPLKELRYENDSVFVTATAGGHFIGSGSTINALHLSELPKWQGSPDKVREQLMSLLNAVPNDPNSLVIIEASANLADPTGEFEARCRAAMGGFSAYAMVFVPWFREASYRMDPAKRRELAGQLKADIERDEGMLREVFGLDDWQLAWRQHTIIDQCGSSVLRFKQDYPATVEECFSVAEGRIFPMLKREIHHRQIDNLDGWKVYRGIDWGGTHPFVCLWVACLERELPAFTIDIDRCPQAWQALTGWSRQDGVPSEKFKDICDALRYVCRAFNLTGHVHVFREYVIANSGGMGLSELDLFERIKMLTAETVLASVADRSRPNSINLANQSGIPCIPMSKPRTTVSGELEDGIGHLHALMISTLPFTTPPPPRPLVNRLIDLMDESPVPLAVGDMALRLEIGRVREVDQSRGHPYLGGCHD